MKTMLILAALALQDRGGTIEWRQDFTAALEEARQASRPALVYFTADW